MILELKDSAEQFICQLDNDEETLSHYGPQEGYTVHVRLSFTLNHLSIGDRHSPTSIYVRIRWCNESRKIWDEWRII